MALLRLKKGDHEPVGKHFAGAEFDCPCPSCVETLIDTDLIDRLDALRDRLGAPIRITSGYRCPAHQKFLAAHGFETAKHSRHLVGEAADIWTGKQTGEQLEAAARAVGFRAVGVAKVWVHVDLRDDKDRRWLYEKR